MKLIRRSTRDLQTLEIIQELGPSDPPPQPASYRNIVVVKPWGYEFLAFENKDVAVWFLHVEKGHSTSMHCHPKKKTALTVLAGQALCNTFYNRNFLDGIDGLVIEAGVFHSTQALSSGGIDLIEVESPPCKTDLVRLRDKYGRSAEGYEGVSEMKTMNLEKYNYFWFNQPDIGAELTRPFSSFSISLSKYADSTPVRDFSQCRRGEFICCASGQLVDQEGNAVLAVGEVAEASFLGTFDGLMTDRSAMLFRFHAGNC